MRRYAPLLPALALALLAAPADAQTRPLYATDGYGPSTHYIIQGGAVTNTFGLQYQCDYGIAVTATVNTVGCYAGNTGGEYTLGGTYIGPTATNTANALFYDGASDGTYNYSVDFYGTGVYRAGLDWSGITPLFGVNLGYVIGITYDSGNNSLWVGQYGYSGSSIFQYAMNGTLLSSFNPNVGGSGITALAYDAADGTLWFSNYDGNATLFQYTTSGTQLNALNVSGTYGGYLIGAEYEVAAVPEPATFMLVGTGLLGVAGMARRRRHA